MKKILGLAAVFGLLLSSCASVWLSPGQLYDTTVHFQEGGREVVLAADFQALMQLFEEDGVNTDDYKTAQWRRIERIYLRDAMSQHNAEYLVWSETRDEFFVIRRSRSGFEMATFALSQESIAGAESRRAESVELVNTEQANW